MGDLTLALGNLYLYLFGRSSIPHATRDLLTIDTMPSPRLDGKTVVIFCDFNFEDMEVMYPKIRLEEEGARCLVVGGHPAGMKYTGKYGYPIKSDLCVDDLPPIESIDALILPGGFAPDYMRRNAKMLAAVCAMVAAGKPTAAICHGPCGYSHSAYMCACIRCPVLVLLAFIRLASNTHSCDVLTAISN